MMKSSDNDFAWIVARRDLLVQKQAFGNRTYWNIKDPVTERFFQLRDEEYFLLRQFEHRNSSQAPTSIRDLAEAFGHQFAPHPLDERQLATYVRTLLSQGLLVDARETGAGLLKRRELLTRQARRAAWLNPLAIRWRGIDPRPLTAFLYPLTRWCFHRLTLGMAAAVMIVAVMILLVHSDEIAYRLPTLNAFFTLQNLFWLAIATAAAKVLHELAHALTCKHFGGDCKELGAMLLVFTPCLYCDVSDAWFFRNKWHRIAVSAAGIVTELFLACVATILWWYSEAGLLNTLSFNTMVVCSVGTVFFNGNPLLKFDGYYMLADWVEVPNLRARASAILGHQLSRLCLGVSSINPRTLPGRGRLWLVTYGIAALVYRVVILVSILVILHRVLKPYGLVSVAEVLGILMIGGFFAAMLMSVRQFLRRVSWSEMNLFRVMITGAVIIGLVTTVFVVPLPHHVVAVIVIEPYEATPVFVRVGGRIPTLAGAVASDGQLVKQGDVLVTLENAALELDVAELAGSVEVLRMRNRSLETRRMRSDTIAGNLSTSKQLLASLEQKLEEKRIQQQSLVLVAPRDGMVIAPEIVETSHEDETQWVRWQGTPLDPSNRGSTLPTGLQLCSVGRTDRVAAIAVVEQSDIPFVQLNQSAKVWIRGCPGRYYDGTVADISLAQFDSAPQTLLVSNTLPMIDDEAGEKRNAEVSFSVRIPIDAVDQTVPLRSIGWVKIEVQKSTLASRARHYFAKTFRSSW